MVGTKSGSWSASQRRSKRFRYRARKLLCGRSHRIVSAQRMFTARSLMIADLGPEESLAVQCRGIGPGRLLGCGLFVPHKGIGPVRRATGDG